MPTAAEYRAAAVRFRSLGAVVIAHADAVARWPVSRDIGPGPALDLTTASVRTVVGHLGAAAEAVAALARLCDDRAEVCDDYHRRLTAHAALDPATQALVAVPLPPFGWVR